MGALSALIVSPCVTAPVAAAIGAAGATGNLWKGASILFALSIGMGLPLLLLSVGARELLPKAGPWTRHIQRLGGILLLAVALSVVYPVFATTDFFQNAKRLWTSSGFGSSNATMSTLKFIKINSLDELQTFLKKPRDNTDAVFQKKALQQEAASAKTQNNLVNAVTMLDFYADWCTSCKEMESTTLVDERVQAKLKQMHLLRADVTKNTDEDKALLKKFALLGPPAILFFDAKGQEIPGSRVIGYQNPGQFLGSLDSLVLP